MVIAPSVVLFQSTRPVWGETGTLEIPDIGLVISIHSPRVGRDADDVVQATGVLISIHSPRVGRDGYDQAQRATY